jgi:hypothetical protein
MCLAPVIWGVWEWIRLGHLKSVGMCLYIKYTRADTKGISAKLVIAIPAGHKEAQRRSNL